MPEGRDAAGWEPATWWDVLWVIAFGLVLSPYAYRSALAFVWGEDEATLVVAVLLGLLAADLATGTVHWLCDTFFAEDTPIIGRSVIEPFREHHVDPLAMTRRAFLRVSNSNVVATTLLLAILLCVQSTAESPPSAFADVWVTSFTFAVMATNQFHKWAHLPQVPLVVGQLQRLGLILSPTEHQRHHTGDHSRAYCVTTGWLNPPLDGAGVFGACERAVALLRRRTAPRRTSG
jgi:ubiquitin-conjugating enzyme E2 variant